MLSEKKLHDLLDKYRVEQKYLNFVDDNYKSPLDDFICSIFPINPHIRYGGSIVKNTANSDSSDIDLLCYFDSSFKMSVESIFNTIAYELKKANYYIRIKNCAICVLGKAGEKPWDVEIDIVPGKYIDNDNNDVNIWQSRYKRNLKTNPIKQLDTVKKSKMKDVIRLIKIYKKKHHFRFKSFFLEMFCIQIVEPLVKDDDSLFQKLFKFCSCYNAIGKEKVIDPANQFGNNLMDIYTEEEFDQIRFHIQQLCEVMLTGNVEGVVKTIENNAYCCDIESLYKRDAKSHSPSLNISTCVGEIRLMCTDEEGNIISSGQILRKDLSLRFDITTLFKCSKSTVKLIVSNAGYEAQNCKRGEEYTVKEIDSNHFYRYETTLYNGDHYVQAIIRNGYGSHYSDFFIVRIRDFDADIG